MKRNLTIAGAVALMLVAGVAAPADAALAKVGTVKCGSSRSFSAATSTGDTVHFHEQAGWFKKVTRKAGRGSFSGWKDGGAVWIEIQTAGRVSYAAVGCSS